MRVKNAGILSLAVAGTLSAVIGVVAVGGKVALGQVPSTQYEGFWTYEWTAPTTGAPVAYYEAMVITNGTDTTYVPRIGEQRVQIRVHVGNDYTVLVRAYDAADRPGPWSDPSSPVQDLCEFISPNNESDQ